MLFVLASLIVTGFLGIAMLKLSGSDTTTNVFYKGSAAARSAAKSGIIDALNEIQTSDPTKRDAMIARLQRWIDTDLASNLAEADRWIVCGPNNGDFKPLSADMEYRVEMLAFDTSNFTVTLKSEGQKSGGGKAKITGTYRLDGLMFDKAEVNTPTNALYLGSGADEMNRAITIIGDTYMNSTGRFYDRSGDQFHFYGDFYLENDNASNIFELKSATFHQKALLDGYVEISKHTGVGTPGNLSEFKNGLGVGKNIVVTTDGEFSVGAVGLYANADIILQNNVGKLTLGSSCEIVLNGSKKYDNAPGTSYTPEDILICDPAKIQKETSVDPKAELQMKKPPQIFADITNIRAKAIKIGRTTGEIQGYHDWTAEYFNGLYSTVAADRFYVDDNNEKWLVLEIAERETGFKESAGKFKGKVIWIVDKTIEINRPLYKHQLKSDYDTSVPEHEKIEGLSLIYVSGSGKLERIQCGEQFRGFIYSESQANENIFEATSNGVFIGGIYQQLGTGSKFRVEGQPLRDPVTNLEIIDPNTHLAKMKPGTFTVKFDQSVIDELEPLGFFINPNNADAKELVLKANHTHISTSMLSSIM